MVDFGFLPENFGNVVRTFKCHLLLCECRWGGGSTWRWWGHLNTTGCNQTCLKFLHSEVLATQKPSFQLPSHPNLMLLHPRWQGHFTTLYSCAVLLLCPCGGHDALLSLCFFTIISFHPCALTPLCPGAKLHTFQSLCPCIWA